MLKQVKKSALWLITVMLLLSLGAAACGAPPSAEEEAAEQPMPEEAAQEEEPDDSMAMGRFINDPHSGRDFNLADYEAEYGVTLSNFNESPMLAEMVAAGTLPPVEERLPGNPAVQIPLEDIGQYGGNLHWVEYTIDYDHYIRHLNETNLLELRPAKGTARYKWMGGELMPGVYESWSKSDGSKTFEFTLRKGYKWSRWR